MVVNRKANNPVAIAVDTENGKGNRKEALVH